MATEATGTKLMRGTTVGSTTQPGFAQVGEVRDITGPEYTSDVVDATHHGSTFEVQIPTILRTGNVTFTVNLSPGSTLHGATDGLQGDWQGRKLRHFRVSPPSSTDSPDTFTAYVTGVSKSFPVGDVQMMDVTLKPIDISLESTALGSTA